MILNDFEVKFPLVDSFSNVMYATNVKILNLLKDN